MSARTYDSGRYSYSHRTNFFFQFVKYEDNKSKIGAWYIYGTMKLVGVTASGRSTRNFQFNRKNFSARYKDACEAQAEMQGWPHAPKSWLKAKPKFDDILKRCHIVEIPNPDKKGKFTFARIGADD